MQKWAWILTLISLLILPGFSPALDCRLGEKYYHHAISETDPKRCIEWLQRSLEVCPNFNAWYMLGLVYKQQGRTDKAIDAFIHARDKAGPPRAEALALGRKGELLAQKGNLPQGLRVLELAKRFHPEPAPHWLEKSLKKTRILSYHTVVSAEDIASYLESETQTSASGRFAIRPAVNLPVQFDFDRADLNDMGMQQIAELGRALTRPKMTHWRILLVGHTDKRGSVAYNQILSEKRANTVKIELERRFPSLIGKLETEGRGEAELLYDGDSKVDHMLNRRVKVTLIQ
jgi:outer membrane protein OmpA-like peptidoglycan-associated protein